jgi:hypothetical protein
MKKTLLATLLLAALSIGNAMAAKPRHIKNAPSSRFEMSATRTASAQRFAAPAKAESTDTDDDALATSMEFGYCYSPYQALTFATGDTIKCAIQITQDVIDKFKGNKVTAISIANGYPASSLMKKFAINVFVTDDLDSTPSQSAAGSMDLKNTWEYKEYALQDTITIDDNTKPFWVGYSAVCNVNVCYPIIVDYSTHTGGEPGCWIYGPMGDDDEYMWADESSQVGFLCIRVKIEGDNLPQNEASFLASYLPTTITTGEEESAQFYVQNNGANSLHSLGFTVTIGDGEPQTVNVDLDTPVAYNEYTESPVEVSFTQPTDNANLAVNVKLATINGNPCNSDATYSIYTRSLTSGFQRNLLFEEGTGTWCGWCPRGIVGMANLLKAHPDGTFIPVAVHSDDVMDIGNYNFMNYNASGFPTGFANRDITEYDEIDPNDEDLADVYSYETTLPAVAKITIDKAEVAEDGSIDVSTSTEFSVAADGVYSVGYIITENGVGPYVQSNYYSPSYGYGMELDGWDDKASTVATVYDHVARVISDPCFENIPEASLGASVETGKTYANAISITSENITNPEKCTVVAMVLNTLTGRVENSTMQALGDDSGINTIEANGATAPARYFNIQGIEVAQPRQGGIYILRQGTQTSKIKL